MRCITFSAVDGCGEYFALKMIWAMTDRMCVVKYLLSEDMVLWFSLCSFCQCYEMSHVASKGAKKSNSVQLLIDLFDTFHCLSKSVILQGIQIIQYPCTFIPKAFKDWQTVCLQLERLESQIWGDWLVVLMIRIKLRPEENWAICVEEKLINV